MMMIMSSDNRSSGLTKMTENALLGFNVSFLVRTDFLKPISETNEALVKIGTNQMFKFSTFRSGMAEFKTINNCDDR